MFKRKESKTEKKREQRLPLNRPGVIPSLILGQVLVISPLFLFLPLWVSLLSVLAIIWRIGCHFKGWILPGKWIRLSLGLLGAGAIVIEHHSLFSKEAGLSLFVMMSSFRLLELKRYRDGMNSVFLSLFLLTVNFLYNQTLFIAIYAAITLFWLLLSLIGLQSLNGIYDLKWVGKSTGKLLLYAVPLAFFLFVLFPRLANPLWQVPEQNSAGSGVSDSMSPGDISSLSLDDELAFMVKFKNEIPEPGDLYWRGLVFGQFDGFVWSRSNILGASDVEVAGEPLDYQITLEPHKRSWLYFLDMTQHASSKFNASKFRNNEQYVYQLPAKVNKRIRYEGVSYLSYKANVQLTEPQRQQYLQLPDDGNPRSREWAQKLLTESASTEDFIQKILKFIFESPFYYTLTPPLLEEDVIDDFWFNSRKGFCEHYASNLVFMARAAGVPARVVVGYQGGKKNPYNDYLVIRQADAHAWTEIWSADRGWFRVDPTAAIHPSRVEQQAARSYRQRQPLFDSEVFIDWVQENETLFNSMQQMMEAINTSWQQWVIEYNQGSQREFLKWMGFKNYSWELLIRLLVGSCFLVLLAWAFLLLYNRQPQDETVKLYIRLCEKLERLGCPRKANEGPLDYQKRITQRRNEWAEISKPIIETYINYRYTNQRPSLDNLNDLRKSLNALKI